MNNTKTTFCLIDLKCEQFAKEEQLYKESILIKIDWRSWTLSMEAARIKAMISASLTRRPDALTRLGAILM